MPGPTKITALRALCLAAWALTVGALTLTPQPVLHDAEEVSRLCVICGGRGTADAVLNVLMFVPFGFLAGSRGALVAAIAGGGLSASIEVAQAFLPGRYATLGDVLWNGTGAWLGALLFAQRVRWLAPRRGLAPFVGVTVGAGMILAGLLLEPSWTRDAYWGQWTADLGSMPQYRGRLRAAFLDEIPIPSRRFPDDTDPRSRLAGAFTLRGLVEKGPPPPGVSPIVSIYDGHQREVVLLGADREDLVWRERTRAAVVKLDQPDLRFPDALKAVAVGETVEIAVTRHGGERCLSVARRAACGLGFTPGRTWSLLLWVDGVGEGARGALDLLWLFGWALVVGSLADTRRGWAGGGACMAVGVFAAVLATRLVSPPLAEWAAVVAGLVVGGLAARLVRQAAGSTEPTAG